MAFPPQPTPRSRGCQSSSTHPAFSRDAFGRGPAIWGCPARGTGQPRPAGRSTWRAALAVDRPPPAKLRSEVTRLLHFAGCGVLRLLQSIVDRGLAGERRREDLADI